jgi:hypothetical protein
MIDPLSKSGMRKWMTFINVRLKITSMKITIFVFAMDFKSNDIISDAIERRPWKDAMNRCRIGIQIVISLRACECKRLFYGKRAKG